jgi:hypothetical protein
MTDLTGPPDRTAYDVSADGAADAMAGGTQASRGDGAVLRDALLDSRQRWRDLVMLSADLVFETDSWGRFVLIAPDSVLGWQTPC